MGMTLDEYIKLHPQPDEPPAEQQQEHKQMQEAAQAMQRRQQSQQAAEERKQTVDELMQSILQQLEAGNSPEMILYTAVKALGTATQNLSFTATAEGLLNGVYGDLAQQSFLTDTAAVADRRLDERQRKFINGVESSLTRKLNDLDKIRDEIEKTLDTVRDLKQQEARTQAEEDSRRTEAWRAACEEKERTDPAYRAEREAARAATLALMDGKSANY